MQMIYNNTSMTTIKQGSNTAFSAFRNSTDGQIEQGVIWQAIEKQACFQGKETILDASCGEGWLSRKLYNLSSNIFAFDISEELIKEAKALNSKIEYCVSDATKSLPYKENFFDYIFWNLGAHDILELSPVYKNFYKILKPNGRLFVLIINPYYSFPVGQWKRGLKKVLPFNKPTLRLKPYNQFKKNPAFTWGQKNKAFFHTFPEFINPCLDLGLKLNTIDEIVANEDSKTFDRKYQLYRFPMLLLLTFKKTLE